MIIFDLDGTLANIDHRRHFVDASYRDDCYLHVNTTTGKNSWYYMDRILTSEPPKPMMFIPDWKSFYEACDKDIPNEPVIDMWNNRISLGMMGVDQIWSGRCESVRKMTNEWLNKNLLCFEESQLKMRPIGDSTPDDQLKEMWLLDLMILEGKKIDFVFDDSETCCNMWRRRGIFVFNCCQHDREF
jgi:hypothetical protein